MCYHTGLLTSSTNFEKDENVCAVRDRLLALSVDWVSCLDFLELSAGFLLWFIIAPCVNEHWGMTYLIFPSRFGLGWCADQLRYLRRRNTNTNRIPGTCLTDCVRVRLAVSNCAMKWMQNGVVGRGVDVKRVPNFKQMLWEGRSNSTSKHKVFLD